MSGKSWLPSSLPLRSGIFLFNLDQPDLKGEDFDHGILYRLIVSRLVVYRVVTKLLLHDRKTLSLPHLASALPSCLKVKCEYFIVFSATASWLFIAMCWTVTIWFNLETCLQISPRINVSHLGHTLIQSDVEVSNPYTTCVIRHFSNSHQFK
jgi:hypothetical protein